MNIKKVLLLTTIYPAPDLKYGTPSVHYFTKEWIKMGYEVRVIHYQAVYPKILYFFASVLRDKIASLTGAVVFTRPDKEDKRYQMDNVTVLRFPIFKWIPHRKFTNKIIKSNIKKIIKINLEDDFNPNIIIGHFSNPQLEIVSQLKHIYQARTCMIMHDIGVSIKKVYKKKYKMLMNNIDVWGYRSKPIKNGFEKEFGKQKESFFCYSGIPDNYILESSTKSFKGNLSKFVYVGELIKRKHAISIIPAINSVYKDKKFHISFVGKGNEINKMKALSLSLQLNDNISFLGHIPRNEILNILDESECMIMISENETFGLVYLEAMGRGCITIGSKNQGIDGVIIDGINGFLCNEGDQEDLQSIIKQINSLSSLERQQISQNAIDTVRKLTDFEAAKKYILEVDKKVS
jgi:glycosyltransferase involved in cell wall biosynthesis